MDLDTLFPWLFALATVVLPVWFLVFRLMQRRQDLDYARREAEVWRKKWASMMAKYREVKGALAAMEGEEPDDEDIEDMADEAEDAGLPPAIAGLARGAGLNVGALQRGDAAEWDRAFALMAQMRQRTGGGQANPGSYGGPL